MSFGRTSRSNSRIKDPQPFAHPTGCMRYELIPNMPGHRLAPPSRHSSKPPHRPERDEEMVEAGTRNQHLWHFWTAPASTRVLPRPRITHPGRLSPSKRDRYGGTSSTNGGRIGRMRRPIVARDAVVSRQRGCPLFRHALFVPHIKDVISHGADQVDAVSETSRVTQPGQPAADASIIEQDTGDQPTTARHRR
jgi:hypothetical protein